jgi:diphosphomevalonate decarboxylase
MATAAAQAFSNIAFIKYWGNRDQKLRLPSTGSISMNLDGLFTRTQVRFDPDLKTDRLSLNGLPSTGLALKRVSHFLDRVRAMSAGAVRG